MPVPPEASRGNRLPAWLILVAGFAAFFAAYFAPVTATGGLLAPGDGAFFYLPFFSAPVGETWNDLILSGYAIATDIQAQNLYPVRWLSPTFNVMVIVAYVVCAVSTFGLVLQLTGSRVSALYGAVLVSSGGFMVGHIGHLSIIHAAAWVPALLWSIAAMRHGPGWRPVAAGAASLALCIYGGHPQISIIGILLAGLYASSELAAIAAAKGAAPARVLFAKLATMLLLGVLLASPAIVGLAVSASDGVRGQWTQLDFNSFSHTLSSLRMAVFPNYFGAQPQGPYGTYSGPFNITELSIYIGIAPWFLAVAAIVGWRRDRRHFFWLGAAVVSGLLCLGTITPLGNLLYELPVVGQFRAQARFGLLLALCMAVLAGLGLSALLRGEVARARRITALAISAVLSAGVLLLSLGDDIHAQAVAAAGDSAIYRFHLPLLLVGLSLAAFAFLLYRPGHLSAMVLLLVLVLDLGSFGWYHDWRYPPWGDEFRDRQELTLRLPDAMRRGDGRVLPMGAPRFVPGPFEANANMLYGVPMPVGYGPLLNRDYAELTGATTTGDFPPMSANAPLLDVLGVRWLAGDPAEEGPLLIGQGCPVQPRPMAVTARVPEGLQFNAFRLVTHMSCSQSLSSGAPVATVSWLAPSGEPTFVATFEAGTHTGEWALDRPDVKAAVKHGRPPVYESFDAGGFQGLWFEALFRAPEGREFQGGTISLEMTPAAGAPMQLRFIEVFDAASQSWRRLPLTPMLADRDAGTRPVAPVEGLPPIVERTGYRGPAWLACEAVVLPRSQLAAALVGTADALPGGGFQPYRQVLLEQESSPGKPELACSEDQTVEVLKRRPGRWTLRTSGSEPSMLVVSSRFLPGWSARLDGQPVDLVAANGLVLGVAVPAGDHVVKLVYRPPYFYLTLSLVLAALLAVTLLALSGRAIHSRFWRTQ
ncbi:hypothetical protein N787_03970 [Arenimonas metalli CF5-1]|uniref:Bacterial membrane protein YfhO n=1 Tax=Arenimonas metalli CF5-1 TaxID=1384056 RepID=A0A091BC32_9GAMM|nr:hypothetical protein N787_03970 [Arenimonas metalli CF5-1]